MTKCENNLCLYWRDNLCKLENIELDINGMCIDCIYVEIPSEILDQKRKEQFEKLEGISY